MMDGRFRQAAESPIHSCENYFISWILSFIFLALIYRISVFRCFRMKLLFGYLPCILSTKNIIHTIRLTSFITAIPAVFLLLLILTSLLLVGKPYARKPDYHAVQRALNRAVQELFEEHGIKTM